MTPAMFIVSALVLPMSKNTARLRMTAVRAFAMKTAGLKIHVGSANRCRTPEYSMIKKGITRHSMQAGEM